MTDKRAEAHDRASLLVQTGQALIQAAAAGIFGGKPITIHRVDSIAGPRAGGVDLYAGVQTGLLAHPDWSEPPGEGWTDLFDPARLSSFFLPSPRPRLFLIDNNSPPVIPTIRPWSAPGATRPCWLCSWTPDCVSPRSAR